MQAPDFTKIKEHSRKTIACTGIPMSLTCEQKLEQAIKHIDGFIEWECTESDENNASLTKLSELLAEAQQEITHYKNRMFSLSDDVEDLESQIEDFEDYGLDVSPLKTIEDRVVAMGQPILSVVDDVMRENDIYIESQYLQGATA